MCIVYLYRLRCTLLFQDPFYVIVGVVVDVLLVGNNANTTHQFVF